MPDIIPYEQRVSPNVRTANRVGANAFQPAENATSVARIGEAAAQLGVTVDRRQQEQLAREREARIGTLRNESRQQSTLGLLEDFQSAKQNAAAGADGFYDGFKDVVDKRRSAAMDLAGQDPAMRQALADDFDRLALPFLADAQEFQAAERVRHRTDVLDGSLNALGNAIVSSPDRFDDYYQQGLASIDAAGADLSADGRRKMLDGWKDSASLAAFNGMLEADPRQALEDAQSKRFDRLWSPETKARAINSAQAEIKRRDAVAKAERAEALQRLGRQVDGAIKVMQAGYKYDGIGDLRAAVKGTEYEPELAFHEAVAGARQDHAFKPLAEQVEILRQVESQPQTEGSLSVIKALKPVTEEAMKAVQGDRVLDYAAEHGVVSLEPIDYESPDSWGNRLRRSDAAASMLGVGQANLLTEREQAEFSAFVAEMPPPEKIEWMAGLRASLDDRDYRQVQRAMGKAKIEPGLDLAADMIARSEKNQPAAQRLLQAFAIDEKALPLERDAKKSAEDGALSAFNDRMGSVLAAQADMLSSDAGRLNMSAEMYEATRRLAMSYAASGRGGGWFQGNAGQSAYNDLFGDYQSVDRDDAILFAESAVGDIDDIADGLRIIRQQNAEAALEWQRPIFMAQYGEQQGPLMFEEYVRDIREGGVWVNGDGGAVLVDPVQGSAIVKPDGTPYVISFEDALRAYRDNGAVRLDAPDPTQSTMLPMGMAR